MDTVKSENKAPSGSPVIFSPDDLVLNVPMASKDYIGYLILRLEQSGVRLTGDDRLFIRGKLKNKGRKNQVAILNEYRQEWVNGMADGNLPPHQIENAGRHKASSYLRTT